MADQPASPDAQVAPAKDPNAGGGYFGAIPRFNDGMTFETLGQTGLKAFGGYVREEFLPQLQGRQAQTVYREMADNSSVIGGMLFAINATMRKVEWRTNAADDTPAAQEMADFADSLRDDMGDTWEETLSEALSMVAYGFAPLEINYKRRLGRDAGPDPRRAGRKLPPSKFDDGRIGWKNLPIRGQDTIIKWFFDENGDVLGMTQQPWVGSIVDIPMEKLLLFRPTQHKNNPEGRSVLRNAYRSYYLVKRIEEQEAILFERLNGIPVIRVPSTLMEKAKIGDADAVAAMNTFRAIAVNLRVDEQMGLVLPSDTFEGPNGPSTVQAYGMELISPGGGKGGGGGVNSNDTINRHQANMMMSVLADFLILGHSKVGTQALSDSKKDLFFQAVEGYLNSTAAVFNRHGLPRVWDLNGLDHDLLPEFTPDLAQSVDLDLLGNFVLRLAQSGMAVFPNADLEAALMDAAGLPDIADTGAADLLGDAADQAPVAIAGPMAAASTQELAPPPPPLLAPPGAKGGPPNGPPHGSPRDQLEKMIRASMARRLLKRAGPSMSINTNRRRMPTR